ncbi:MAG: hypothetical protein PVI21_03995 [Candidatus Woesebacteria bacterium]|jgi:formate hydrogenlyase subunit 3/multisubunit Na+/H+ antiporter MnhD subunit
MSNNAVEKAKKHNNVALGALSVSATLSLLVLFRILILEKGAPMWFTWIVAITTVVFGVAMVVAQFRLRKAHTRSNSKQQTQK